MVVEWNAEKRVEFVVPQLHHVLGFPLFSILDLGFEIVHRFEHDISRSKEVVAGGVVGKDVSVRQISPPLISLQGFVTPLQRVIYFQSLLHGERREIVGMDERSAGLDTAT